MRFLFIGAVESSATLLRAAIAAGADIVAVATLPPENGRGRHADYVDLAPIASAARIPLRHVENNDGLEAAVSEFAPDALLVWGWSRLIPEELLGRLKFGGIGFHPAPLPHGRGRHPLIWTILLGLPASAVCFFRLTQAADAGDIIHRRDFSIPAGIDARELMDLVLREASLAIPDLLAGIRFRGDLSGVAQPPSEGAAWRKRSATDGKIDFRMTGEAVDRLVRALGQPYPGAEAEHSRAGRGKVWRVEFLPMRPEWRYAEPGRVLESVSSGSAHGPLVRCDNGAVCLREHEFLQPITPGSWFC